MWVGHDEHVWVGHVYQPPPLTGSVTHEGRTMSNAQALLQSAWLGDSVSVKKHLVSS